VIVTWCGGPDARPRVAGVCYSFPAPPHREPWLAERVLLPGCGRAFISGGGMVKKF
jgi:hypothetical protein